MCSSCMPPSSSEFPFFNTKTTPNPSNFHEYYVHLPYPLKKIYFGKKVADCYLTASETMGKTN